MEFRRLFKKENKVIGYLTLKNDAIHDFGYALRSDFWNQGIITEASNLLFQNLKKMEFLLSLRHMI